MRTTLYLASTEALKDAALFARLLRTVPPSRQEKIGRLRVARARRLSLGAGLLLNYALAAQGLPVTEPAVSENGKPYFPALPDFHFNLSHSGELALCAVSPTPVGCDVETVSGIDLAVARRFFHPEERAWLFSLPEGEREAAFLRLWTCKESFIKAVGLGLALPLEDFSVSLGDAVTLRQGVDARPWRLRSLRDGGAFYALCGLEGVEDAPFVRVSPEAL